MTLNDYISLIRPLDEDITEKSRKYWLSLAKPLFGAGELENIITRIAGIRGSLFYSLDKKCVVLMCADNGVVAEGVTQTDQSVTATVAGNFRDHISAVCVMADIAHADIVPIDIGIAVDVDGVTDSRYKLAYGTNNIRLGAAMTRGTAERAVVTGIEIVGELKQKGYDIIATGEMGIGNTTTSSAVVSVLLDRRPEQVTGRGAGLSTEGLNRKIQTIYDAININKPNKDDPLDVLHKVGGLDIAGMAGLFIGGAVHRLPIVIDGFISAAAALIAVKICPAARDFIIPSHVSREPAGMLLLDALGFQPLINAGMNLGEGTGAAAVLPLLDMGYALYSRLKTFEKWDGGVTYTVLK